MEAMAMLNNPAPAVPALENGNAAAAAPAVGGGNAAAAAAAAGPAIVHPELDAIFAENVVGASEEDDLLADE
jgi:hypothetical protein